MSVAFYSCAVCGDSICDHGSHLSCRDICERKWCGKECATKDGYKSDVEDPDDPNDFSCNFCRNEDVENHILFNFLISEYGLSRESVLKMYLKKQQILDVES